MVDLGQVPSSPGCYLFRDARGTILYIGKAKDLKKRVSSYFQRASPDPRIRAMVEELHRVCCIETTYRKSSGRLGPCGRKGLVKTP